MLLTVELLYGFSSISWTEEPRDSIVNNGYELYKAGHIFNVKEIRADGKPTPRFKLPCTVVVQLPVTFLCFPQRIISF